MSHNIMNMSSNSYGQNGTANKVKEEDFLNIFDFSATADNNEDTHGKSPKSHGDYLPHLNNDSTGVSSQSYNTNENFNDLNKLLTNTVGNSEYLDIPFPMVFSNNDDYKQNNMDFDDSGSLMSYTTNNTYTSNNTAGGRRKYSKSINAGVAGSVKSYRSYTADSIDDQMAKERKKQIHNNVEKNRRELIKKKIKELSEIIPISVMKRVAANALNEGAASSSSTVYTPETVDVRKIKYRKRDILCGSVIYIGLLREVVDGVNKKIDKYNALANKLKERIRDHQPNSQKSIPAPVQRTSRLPDLNDNFNGNLQKLNDDFLELLNSLGNVDSKNQHTFGNTENKNQEPDFESIFREQLDKIKYPIPDNNMNFNGGYDELFKNVMNHASSDSTGDQKSTSASAKIEQSNNPSTEGIYDDAFASWLDHS